MYDRDPDAAARFVERFAGVMASTGMPSMPARILAAVLTEDTGRLTAAELAERLQISPAAVSGAVRFLVQHGMVSREREPGARRDSIVVHDDQWQETMVHRDALVGRWEAAAKDGVEVLGADTPAGRRMAQTQEFFAFLRAELPILIADWRARRPADAVSP